MATLKGLRFVAFVGAITGAIGLTLYPIVIKPYFNPSEYKNLRKLHSWDGYKKST